MIQSAGAFVSKELRADEGACVAVAYIAALHGTDPIMTASKAFPVNGRLAFEAQYLSALVRQHIDEPFDITFHGTGAQRFARVVGKVKGKALDYQSPQLGQIKVRNSPLWAVDPDQQLGAYYSVRAWARRHMPDVLLGIYAVEELQNISIRDVTPLPPANLDAGLPVSELEHVEATEEPPFEPSGGFTGTEAMTTLSPVADDPTEWAMLCKQDAETAGDVTSLKALWVANKANREALKAQDPAVYRDLEDTFIDRQKALTEAASGGDQAVGS